MHTPTPLAAVIASEQFRDRSRALKVRHAARLLRNEPRSPSVVLRRTRRSVAQPRPGRADAAVGSERAFPLRGVAARHVAVLVTAISALVLVAAAVFTGPSASAHTATIATQHSLAVSSGVPSGQLSSTVPACLSGRTITLYRVDIAGPSVAATTSTTSTGAWTRSALTLSGGDYYAVAAAKVIRKSGHKHNCASAKSNTVAVAVDADRDGYPLPGDCQDADPTINPGAAEVRNGVDDDCDGFIDEGLDPAPTTCWVPSTEAVTAVTTWSQLESTEPCRWELNTWSVLPGAVYMVSSEWLIEYRPAIGGAAAFGYDGQDWAYYATHPNAIYGGD